VDAWPALTVTGVVALGLFAYAHAIHPARPGALNPPGWYGFFDQSHYLDLARDLAAGQLPTPPDYIYGLGYPILAAPFVKLRSGGDAFLAVDALAFVATMVMVVALGRRLRSTAFGVASAAVLVVATPLLDTVVVPWNTTVTVVAVLCALVVATSSDALRWPHGLALGLAVGLAFAARYVDAAFPALIGGAALLHAGRPAWRAWLAAGLTALSIAALVLASQAAVLGSPWKSPYSQQPGKAGAGTNQQTLANFEFERVPRNFVEVFVTGKSEGQRQTVDPLGRQFIWAILAPLGAVALGRRRHPLFGPFAVALATSVIGTVFYLSYPGSRGDHLIYGNIHYWKAWFPLWGLLAAYGFLALTDRLPAGPSRSRRAVGGPNRADR